MPFPWKIIREKFLGNQVLGKFLGNNWPNMGGYRFGAIVPGTIAFPSLGKKFCVPMCEGKYSCKPFPNKGYVHLESNY